MPKYIAKIAINHDNKEFAIGKVLPDLTEDQAADLLALGAIEEAPEGKAPAKAKAEKGAE